MYLFTVINYNNNQSSNTNKQQKDNILFISKLSRQQPIANIKAIREMFRQQNTRVQSPQLQPPIYQAHTIERQSVPLNIPSQIARTQQSTYYKINSSTKKTNKISLYSKKNTNSVQKIKSPKKNDYQINQTTNQSSSKTNNAFVNIKNLGDNLLGQMNNIIENNIKSTIPILMSKINKKNTNYTANSNMIVNSQPYKINSEKRIPQKYNFQYSNQQQNVKYNMNNNKNNISQMIQKQVQSQLNSCGTIYDNTQRQTSFFTTGRSGGTYNNQQHSNGNSNINNGNVIRYQQQQNIITSVTPTNVKNNKNQTLINQQIFQNIYKCMRQQIFIAKQNYQNKFIDTIKQNASKIKQLQVKIQKNSLLLKQKNQIIQKMNLKIISLNNNQKQQRSLSMGSNYVNIIPQQTIKYEHVLNKINDVQSKLKIFQNYSFNSNKSQNSALIKLQILQKYLINYFSKIIEYVYQQIELKNHQDIKISSLNSLKNEIRYYKFQKNQINAGLDKNGMNKLKQIINKFKCLQCQSKQFMTRQFKYDNVGVEQLKLKYDDLKQKIRLFQGHQFQNSKLTKKLSSQMQVIIKTFQSQPKKQIQYFSPTPQSPLQKIYFIKNLNSSQIQQTYSKYTRTNPNNPNISSLSNYSNMNSFDQLSQTNQYSYIVEKISQNSTNTNGNTHGNAQYYLNLNINNINNINKNKQSIVNQNNNRKNIRIPNVLSNINMNMDMNNITQNKDQSSIISMNFTQQLDNQQLQSLMYDTQNKPNNNNDDKDLKNTNAQLNTPSSTKKSILYNKNNKNNISHNNSYLSIGQMQDYHQNLNTISTQSRNLLDSRQKYHMNPYLNMNMIESPQRLYSRSIHNDQDDDQFFYYENVKNSNKKYKQHKEQSQYISQQQQTFSPIKNKIFVSTQSNFYNNKNNYNKKNINIINNNNHNNNINNNFNIIQSQKRIKPSSNQDISHSSVSFDYQTFVQSDQENQKSNQKDNNFALKINMNKKIISLIESIQLIKIILKQL